MKTIVPNKIGWLFGVAGLVVIGATVDVQANGAEIAKVAPPVTEVKAIAKGYAGSLQSILIARMADAGPANALDVCSTEASQIGSEIAREKGWAIRRVTDRARNPQHMPDEYEAKVLNMFSNQLGDSNIPLVSYEVVNENGVRYARFMKGIRMKPLCITCHGDKSTIPAEVDQKLTQLYPHDKARGYKQGDLRGAISIKIELD